jgi:hypothetical protein
MHPNIIPFIADIINNAEHPVLILTVAEGCENRPAPIAEEIERTLKEHPTPVIFYKWCISEQDMVFPRTQTPTVYFFLPKNQNVAFWRHMNILPTLKDDVEIIHQMSLGKSYAEARFTKEERETIERVEAFLEKETAEIEKYPSTFKMARNLAKEVWETGKKAAKGLPIIVSAEVGYHRLQTCEGCDKFESDSSRCRECGCFMKVKTQLATASCPLGKWESMV